MNLEKITNKIYEYRDEIGESWHDTLHSPEIREFLNNIGYEAWYTPCAKTPFLVFPKGSLKAISKGVI